MNGFFGHDRFPPFCGRLYGVLRLTVLAGLLTACSGGSGDDDGAANGLLDGSGDNSDGSERACSLAVEKQQILDIMQDWYFWNDEAAQADKYADIDLSDYVDGEALLDYLRYRPNSLDRGFSHVTTPAEEQAFFGEGQFVGFGFSFLIDGNGDVRFSQVYPDGPAGEAGIERGYTLLAIDGESVNGMSGAEISQALGPSEADVTRTLEFADRDGTAQAPVELTKRTVTIDPVPVATVIRDDGDNPVAGYLVLRTFIGPAETALRDAFEQFGTAGIDTLIVDLRYNGGGRIDTAAVFASLMAGPGNAGNVFVDFQFNSDRAAQNNQREYLASEANAITLDTIVFITTNFSASASELVINGLEPYFNTAGAIAGVGSSTFGKPVGQAGFDFCDETQRLRPVTFKTVNADGDGDYFNGLPVDCAVADDLTLPFGDENEAMLSTALSYAETGGCPTAGGKHEVAAQGSGGKPQMIGGPAPWQRYAGAH